MKELSCFKKAKGIFAVKSFKSCHEGQEGAVKVKRVHPLEGSKSIISCFNSWHMKRLKWTKKSKQRRKSGKKKRWMRWQEWSDVIRQWRSTCSPDTAASGGPRLRAWSTAATTVATATLLWSGETCSSWRVHSTGTRQHTLILHPTRRQSRAEAPIHFITFS